MNVSDKNEACTTKANRRIIIVLYHFSIFKMEVKTSTNFESKFESADYMKKENRIHCPIVMPKNPKLIRGDLLPEKVA